MNDPFFKKPKTSSFSSSTSAKNSSKEDISLKKKKPSYEPLGRKIKRASLPVKPRGPNLPELTIEKKKKNSQTHFQQRRIDSGSDRSPDDASSEDDLDSIEDINGYTKFSKPKNMKVEEETVEGKRNKLAKVMLSNFKDEGYGNSSESDENDKYAGQEDEGDIDAADIDEDLLASRRIEGNEDELHYTEIKRSFQSISVELQKSLKFDMKMKRMEGQKHHKGTITSIALSPCGKYCYAADKLGNLFQYELETGTRTISFRVPKILLPEQGKVNTRGYTSYYAIALNPSGKFLVAAGRDAGIYVWETAEGTFLKCLNQHRGEITGLSFRQITPDNVLYSCGKDRVVKVWDIDQLVCLDSLFGHQDTPLAIDALSKERCLTVGARDRTARLYKIVEGTQLVFKAEDSESSLDSVAFLDEGYFVTGSEAGSLSLWQTGRKKPLATIQNAHKSGIQAVGALCYSDVVASGGADGYLKLWKITADRRSIEFLADIPLVGCITDIIFNTQFASVIDLKLLVSVADEPRLGRWIHIPDSDSGIHLLQWNS